MVVVQGIIDAGVAAITAPIRRIHCLAADGSEELLSPKIGERLCASTTDGIPSPPTIRPAILADLFVTVADQR